MSLGGDQESSSTKVLNVIVFGLTGKGKSTLCETLTGKKGLISPSRSSACTKYVTAHSMPATSSGQSFTVFDTPGFGQGEESDALIIREFCTEVNEMPGGIVMIFYVKSALDRLSSYDTKNIRILRKLFGVTDSSRFVILLSNSDLEDSLKSLQTTVEHHQKNLVDIPVYPFFGKGESFEESRRLVVNLLNEASTKETFIAPLGVGEELYRLALDRYLAAVPKSLVFK